MREYTIGREYEFIVNYYYPTRDDQGQDRYWLSLCDGESEIEYKVPAYPCQKSGYEGKTVICKVIEIRPDGYLHLFQRRSDVLTMLYKKGETYWFSVRDKQNDPYTQRPYYLILDRINNIQHRFYCSETDELSGLMPFKVQDIKEHYLVLAVSDTKDEERKELYLKDNPFGHEDQHHEWKASLVFTANSSDPENPEVEKQIKNIMRSIAGFQNAEGGLLYIGVSDNGHICGIESDFAFLNEGDDNMTYKQNTDGFESKIRNAVNHYLGKESLENIRFKFYRQQSTRLTFCIITISKAKRPIYVEGRDIIKRFGNGSRNLKGEEITNFVWDKRDDNSEDIDFPVVIPNDCVEVNPNDNVEVNQTDNVVRLDQQRARGKKDYYYMTFYTDNNFMYSKDSHTSDPNVITEIRFNKIDGNLEYSKDILIKCSKDGFATCVSAFDLCKSGDPNTPIELNTENVLTVKVARKYDFLKIKFKDTEMNEREKYMRLTSIFGTNTENNLTANADPSTFKRWFECKGRMIIPNNYVLNDVEVIHETLPDQILFVSPNPGSEGKGCIVGEKIDPSSY